MRLIEQQSELKHNQIKYEYDKLLEEYNEQKQKFKVQLGKATNNLLLQIIQKQFHFFFFSIRATN